MSYELLLVPVSLRGAERSACICLTGSRVYGEPREDSDYDIVLLVTHEQLFFLADAAGVDLTAPPPRVEDGCTFYETGPDNAQLKFGKLNVIALTNPFEFYGWVKGTEQCKQLVWDRANENPTVFPFGRPDMRVSRAEAKKILIAAVDKSMQEALVVQLPDYEI